MSTLKEDITTTIKNNHGILFAAPQLVGRHTYLGRDIIAPNSNILEHGDERGYVPVEWWICSLTFAGNPILKDNEGVARFYIHNQPNPILLPEMLQVAEQEVMGNSAHAWPLIKVLDIGGSAITPNITSTTSDTTEVPPIPAHVHNGYVVNGCVCGHGKLEAYFFPPLPKGTEPFVAKTRLGIKPNTTKETLVRCMKCFGVNDNMYEQLNVFPVSPFSGWTIECGVIHAPGPYPTFEVQLPQDDGNLLAWQLGQEIKDAKQRTEEMERSMLKTAASEEDLFDQVVKFSLTSDPDFMKQFYHPSQTIEEGDWGKRRQTFFNRFYGEAIEIAKGQTYVLQADERPCSMVVWSGKGTMNGNIVEAETANVVGLTNMRRREMIICPNTQVDIVASDEEDLLLLSVYPFKPAVEKRKGIVCAGLTCVDYVIKKCGELKTSTDHVTAESYERRCGGSVYNTAKAIVQIKPNVRVEALTLIGIDTDGDLILKTLNDLGVGTKYLARTDVQPTQVAFLPVYNDGERACIVIPGASSVLNKESLLGEVGLGCKRIDMVREVLWFHLGYPFELVHMQGDALAETLLELRHKSVDVAISMDLNGAASSLLDNPWSLIEGALQHVCHVHMNWDEACAFSENVNTDIETATTEQLSALAQPFLDSGVALVTITLGRHGAFIQIHEDVQHVMKQFGVAAPRFEQVVAWSKESSVRMNLPSGSEKKTEQKNLPSGSDTVGAGDAFTAGLLVALEGINEGETKSLTDILLAAQMAAFQTISTN